MKITSQCVVALTWTLKDTLGEVLDQLDEPVEFLLGGDDLLAKIEEAMQGHEAGDALDLHLEPENTFGDYDENLVFLEPRALFPAELEEGMTFEGAGLPDGMKVDLNGRIFCTGPSGVWVYEPDGTFIGIIETPEVCANVAFGGADLRTLLLTSSTSVFTLRMKTPGVAHPWYKVRGG